MPSIMKKIKVLWQLALVALTSSAAVTSSGIDVVYLFVFRKKVHRSLIRRLAVTTLVKNSASAAHRPVPLLAYCLAEGESGETLSAFRLKNPQSFRATAKRYGLKVDSYIRSQAALSNLWSGR